MKAGIANSLSARCAGGVSVRAYEAAEEETESGRIGKERASFPQKMEGGRFELPNPKERIYSPPRLATSLPLHMARDRIELPTP